MHNYFFLRSQSISLGSLWFHIVPLFFIELFTVPLQCIPCIAGLTEAYEINGQVFIGHVTVSLRLFLYHALQDYGTEKFFWIFFCINGICICNYGRLHSRTYINACQ